jgi:hypothetical protein
MKSVPASARAPVEINGDMPTLRLLALLETVASKDQLFSLQCLAQHQGTPHVRVDQTSLKLLRNVAPFPDLSEPLVRLRQALLKRGDRAPISG